MNGIGHNPSLKDFTFQREEINSSRRVTQTTAGLPYGAERAMEKTMQGRQADMGGAVDSNRVIEVSLR